MGNWNSRNNLIKVTEIVKKAFGRRDLTAIFLLSLFLRLTVFIVSCDQVGTSGVLEKCFDCSLYLAKANAILMGNGGYENAYFYFGPGYPLFLALNMFVMGNHPELLIILNIIISSFSTLLIYKLAMMLTRSYATSIIAAILTSVSYTAINLSCFLMSDTLFYFVFLSGLIVFIHALFRGELRYFIGAGLIWGIGVLIRPVLQFWPIIIVIIAITYYMASIENKQKYKFQVKNIIGKTLITVLIIFSFMSAWIIRNYKTHNVATMAISSINGPANIAAITIERLTGIYSNDIMKSWVDDYLIESGKSEASYEALSHIYKKHTYDCIDTLGWEMSKTYLSLLWENLNTVSFLHRVLYDDFNPKIDHWVIKYIDYHLVYTCLILSLMGMVILAFKRHFFALMVLAGVYFYYASMLGFYRWQYTRHFLPGQIAWAILVGITIFYLFQLTRRLLNRYRSSA